ncbi:Nif3-like dinuclear metal center hexameric protein [Gracilibacillus salinarum]|uniref:GTP cyclohydrolase 1 type 2 homolog n=1 Tax=Gracilibacillus salinarum TaxID=2932255 RepID=A0ABY4GLQ1_9BACI|nr:Nif3-like dinuclear metal center hexameric protein [Gracilibacillus salinarum]UOQ85110.1 Nif3-like dinuclear metal center hexameric protein [Gracilibacillus salinarum]
MVTVQQVINDLRSNTPSHVPTVDTIKFGDKNKDVKGIAVAYMPSYQAILKAISNDANMLICHEGLFYRHDDNSVEDKSDVFIEKKRLIEESGLTVFRYHDHIHRLQPDGIEQGMINTLAWQPFLIEHQSVYSLFKLPTQTLELLLTELKQKLVVDRLRYVGNLTANISKVALLVGYRGGGATALPPFVHDDVDAVIYGEGPEWETPEYVRDANAIGNNKAAIILGHLESEEPGMYYLAEKLRQRYPGIPVSFIASENCIKTM